MNDQNVHVSCKIILRLKLQKITNWKNINMFFLSTDDKKCFQSVCGIPSKPEPVEWDDQQVHGDYRDKHTAAENHRGARRVQDPHHRHLHGRGRQTGWEGGNLFNLWVRYY